MTVVRQQILVNILHAVKKWDFYFSFKKEVSISGGGGGGTVER